MLKESYLPQIENDANFKILTRPLPASDEIRDAEFYIRRDGIIFNADGYAHPKGGVVGNPLYVPDARSSKEIFGIPYRKIYSFPETHEAIPYAQMGKLLREIDPELDQTEVNPWPFQHEQILPLEQFSAFIPADSAFVAATQGRLGDPAEILGDLQSLIELMGSDLSESVLGLTGAPALGQVQHYNDLDLVFRGTLEQNRGVADRMRKLLQDEPERRLHEGGKSWLIRFFNRDGHRNGTLMCCFFGYQNLSDAPLRDFDTHLLIPDLELYAYVADARHALYTPTIVNLHDAVAFKIGGENAKDRLPDDLPLIIYHTASRGELNNGDMVWAHGALVEVSTPQYSYPAVVVIEREGVRNETPPWENYYNRDRI